MEETKDVGIFEANSRWLQPLLAALIFFILPHLSVMLGERGLFDRLSWLRVLGVVLAVISMIISGYYIMVTDTVFARVAQWIIVGIVVCFGISFLLLKL